MNNSMLFLLVTLALALPTSRAVADEATRKADLLPVQFFKNLREGKKQTVLVYGTSLTAGGPWAVALKDWLNKQFPEQVKFVNSGGSGQNSAWGVKNLQAKVIAHNPDLVFIEFSYNDAHQRLGTPYEQAAKNLDTIVQAIRAQNPQSDIVLQTMNVPWDATDKVPLTNRPKLEEYNEIYRRYAREHNLPLLDHYQAWLKLRQDDPKQYEKWLPDGSHPTKEASLAVTWPAIQSLLERAQKAAGE